MTPVISQFLISDVLPLLATALSLLAAKLLHSLIVSRGLHISAAREAQIDGILGKAVAFAEEKGAASLKASPNFQPDKMTTALSFALKSLDDAGLPSMVAADVEDLLTAKLGVLPGVGASGKPTVTSVAAATTPGA